MAGEPRLSHLVLERSGSGSGAAGGVVKAHKGGQRKARQRRVLAGSSHGILLTRNQFVDMYRPMSRTKRLLVVTSVAFALTIKVHVSVTFTFFHFTSSPFIRPY
jgi:hypothetical protein